MRIGDEFELTIKASEADPESVQFMGLVHSFYKEVKFYHFFSAKTEKIHLIKADDFEFAGMSLNKGEFEFSSSKKFADRVNKNSKFTEISTQGPTGTCAAHAIYNCMLSFDLQKRLDDADYFKKINTERERFELTGRLTKELYDGEGSQWNDIMNFLKNDQKLDVFPHTRNSAVEFKTLVLGDLDKGWPVFLNLT
jgi:hypothetical protein